MNKKPTISLFLLLFLINQAHGMDIKQPSKVKTRLFSNENDLPGTKVSFLKNKENIQPNLCYITKNIPGEYEKVIKDPHYKFFYGSSYAATHKRLFSDLENREKNGAYIDFKCGIHPSNIPIKLKNITFTSDNHEKKLLACEKDPSLGSPGKNIMITGSSNWTFRSYHNHERAAIIHNNKQLFLQGFDAHIAQSLNEQNKIVNPTTPEKSNFISSKNVLLNQTEICRTETATKNASTGNIHDSEIIKSSMNYNYRPSGESLINFVKQGGKAHLIVNETALLGGEELLTEMNDAGVNVRVTKGMNHAKLFVRYIDGKYYSAIGTNNTTPDGNRESNKVFESTDPQFGKTIMDDQKQHIKTNTISLTEAKKRKLDTTTKKTPLLGMKKQKK